MIQSFRDVRLASLVASHSEVAFEARLRGYAHALHAFPREYSAVADALTFCDMTTSPKGNHISFEERIVEILCRYKEQDIVSLFVKQRPLYLVTLSVQSRCFTNAKKTLSVELVLYK